MMNTMDAFRKEIEKAGLTPPETILADGEIHRFSSNGDRNDDAGWYVLYSDCLPAGSFGDWRSGLKQNWCVKSDRQMSAMEGEEYRIRLERTRQQRQSDERLRHAEAAQKAQAIWNEATPATGQHPYLQKKGICPHGLRVAPGRVDDGDVLIVPVTIDGTMTSLQFIYGGGAKRFLRNGAITVGSYTIGDLTETSTVLLCEGFATAASLYEATGILTVMAFSACNLRPVAVQLRQQLPTATIVVCGDNDLSNTGQRAARDAADAINGVVALPEVQGQDFNDVHILRGLDAVRFCVENATLQTTATPQASTAASRAIFRRVADVQASPIRWLWPGRIAQGKVSIIAGNPGLGKSQVTVGMAATVSTGGRWPVDGQGCEVGNVIILSAEDDPSDTIRPRLEAAGADLSRVYILDAVLDGPLVGGSETPRAFNLKTDIGQLERMLKEIDGAALIIIDPITAYLGATDSHKNAEIRALLSPLAELAGRYGAAVVAVSHFNKNANTEALMRVTGSLAFVAAARAAYVVAKDSEHEARRLFLPLKNNLGNDQTGLAFTVESAHVESAIGRIETSRVVWESSAVTVTAEEAMKPQVHDEERNDLDDAKDFLRGLLADGPVPSKQIERDAKGAGHAWRTIQRAQKALGIVAVKKGMKEGWVWQSALEDRHDSPKHAVAGGWQPSYSSGGVGGLQGDNTLSVEVEI